MPNDLASPKAMMVQPAEYGELRMNYRTVMSTWIIAGGLWVAGMVGLSATGICGEAEISRDTAHSEIVYRHTGTWMPYQHPSGKYTVSIRSQRPL